MESVKTEATRKKTAGEVIRAHLMGSRRTSTPYLTKRYAMAANPAASAGAGSESQLAGLGGANRDSTHRGRYQTRWLQVPFLRSSPS